jgi:hypothetical protein
MHASAVSKCRPALRARMVRLFTRRECNTSASLPGSVCNGCEIQKRNSVDLARRIEARFLFPDGSVRHDKDNTVAIGDRSWQLEKCRAPLSPMKRRPFLRSFPSLRSSAKPTALQRPAGPPLAKCEKRSSTCLPGSPALQYRLSRRKACTVSESQLQLVNKFPCEGLPEI